jgi:hypothetical protein
MSCRSPSSNHEAESRTGNDNRSARDQAESDRSGNRGLHYFVNRDQRSPPRERVSLQCDVAAGACRRHPILHDAEHAERDPQRNPQNGTNHRTSNHRTYEPV